MTATTTPLGHVRYTSKANKTHTYMMISERWEVYRYGRLRGHRVRLLLLKGLWDGAETFTVPASRCTPCPSPAPGSIPLSMPIPPAATNNPAPTAAKPAPAINGHQDPLTTEKFTYSQSVFVAEASSLGWTGTWPNSLLLASHKTGTVKTFAFKEFAKDTEGEITAAEYTDGGPLTVRVYND